MRIPTLLSSVTRSGGKAGASLVQPPAAPGLRCLSSAACGCWTPCHSWGNPCHSCVPLSLLGRPPILASPFASEASLHRSKQARSNIAAATTNSCRSPQELSCFRTKLNVPVPPHLWSRRVQSGFLVHGFTVKVLKFRLFFLLLSPFYIL